MYMGGPFLCNCVLSISVNCECSFLLNVIVQFLAINNPIIDTWESSISNNWETPISDNWERPISNNWEIHPFLSNWGSPLPDNYWESQFPNNCDCPIPGNWETSFSGSCECSIFSNYVQLDPDNCLCPNISLGERARECFSRRLKCIHEVYSTSVHRLVYILLLHICRHGSLSCLLMQRHQFPGQRSVAPHTQATEVWKIEQPRRRLSNGSSLDNSEIHWAPEGDENVMNHGSSLNWMDVCGYACHFHLLFLNNNKHTVYEHW